jgi:hypothetical protein
LRVSSVLHAAPKASRPSSCDKRCGGRVCIELPRERGNLESGYEFDATQFPRESLDSGVPMPMFTLKVTLEGIRPPIWRRFVVPAGFSLSQLHRVLQIVMGWTDSHLHQFERGHTIYGLPDPDFGGQHEDERRTRLDAVLERKADWMTYEYDFGDSWTHRVVLEKVEPDVARSAVIVAERVPVHQRIAVASGATSASSRRSRIRITLNIGRCGSGWAPSSIRRRSI